MPATTSGRSPVELLPPGISSLARGVPDAPAGTLFLLSDRGGIRVSGSTHGFTVVFGRNRPDVHVCVGEDDPRMSRRHGSLQTQGGRWTLTNTGGVPIRLPESRLLLTGQETGLTPAYTPMFIRTEPGREHLVEVRVAGHERPRSRAAHEDVTGRPAVWRLSDRERLVLTALGQRYLRHEAHPQPLSWTNVYQELDELQPGEGWTAKQAEWVVKKVRERLHDGSVPGLTRDEVGEPIGNALNHNLLVELLQTTTLVPPDLRLLDGDA
jgi:hypothetical protein